MVTRPIATAREPKSILAVVVLGWEDGVREVKVVTVLLTGDIENNGMLVGCCKCRLEEGREWWGHG